MYKEKYPDIRTARKYKRNKRLRYLKYQRHLRQLWTITRHHSIFPPVEYVNKIYVHGHFCERKIPIRVLQTVFRKSWRHRAEILQKALKQTYQAL